MHRWTNHGKTAMIILVASAMLLAGCQTEQEKATEERLQDDTFGFHVESVRLTSEGYMLDVRYAVTDADKAHAFFQNQPVKPTLVHQESGSTLIVPSPPKVGPLTQTSNPPLEGKTYFILFANPGRTVKPGDHVTLRMNDFEARDLAVK